jgi:hypothetical protein
MRLVVVIFSPFAIISSLLFSPQSFAHGGGLDASGCHHDRKHGGYHCHNGNSQPTPQPVRRDPVQSESHRPLGFITTPSSAPAYDREVEIVQKMLAGLGYEPGTPDGRLGPKTEQAISAFQSASGMSETGMITMALIDALIAKLAE